jgi:hypothetical protein
VHGLLYQQMPSDPPSVVVAVAALLALLLRCRLCRTKGPL